MMRLDGVAAIEVGNGAGHFEDAVIADPQFADAQNREFVLDGNSPAFAAGFTPWQTKAGSIYFFE